MENLIYLAPLQGFTDFIYRKAFDEVFAGTDAFFIPYISLKNGQLLKKYNAEILPGNNPQKKVVPQVLAGNAEELLSLAGTLKNYRYTEINLNLGCPYPMVTNRRKGSGLLPFPEKIKRMLTPFFEKQGLKLSVKMRAGLNHPDEIKKVIPVLNEFPLTEVILHPRIGKQLYEGEIFETAFLYFIENCCHKKIFNGDTFSVNDFEKRISRFPQTDGWMLGRGLLTNPFLPAEIKGKTFSAEEKRETLKVFHQCIFEGYSSKMDNAGNILNKMKQFWIYFSFNFPEKEKVFKKIKKAGSLQVYQAEVNTVFR